MQLGVAANSQSHFSVAGGFAIHETMQWRNSGSTVQNRSAGAAAHMSWWTASVGAAHCASARMSARRPSPGSEVLSSARSTSGSAWRGGPRRQRRSSLSKAENLGSWVCLGGGGGGYLVRAAGVGDQQVRNGSESL